MEKKDQLEITTAAVLVSCLKQLAGHLPVGIHDLAKARQLQQPIKQPAGINGVVKHALLGLLPPLLKLPMGYG